MIKKRFNIFRRRSFPRIPFVRLHVCSSWLQEPKVIIGVGDTSLRMMVVRGRRVEQWGAVDLPPGVVRAGVVQEPQSFAQKLSGLLRSHGVKTRRVFFTVADEREMVRPILIPRLNAKETGEAIRRECQRLVQLPLQDLQVEWLPLSKSRDLREILLVAMLRHFAEANAKAISTIGLKPAFASLKTLALARVAHRPNAVMLNVEPEGLDLVVVHNRIPVYTKTLFHEQKEGLSEEQWVELIRQELNRAFSPESLALKEGATRADFPLVLTGLAATHGGFAERIAESTQIITVPFRPPFHYPADFSAAEYGVCLGLALTIESKAMSILQAVEWRQRSLSLGMNLIPQALRPKPLPVKRYSFIAATVGAILLMFWLYQQRQDLAGENKAMAERLHRVERNAQLRLAQNRKAIELTKKTKDAVETREQLLAQFAGITKPNPVIGQELKTLIAQGKDVEISDWNLDRAIGSVKGEAPSAAQVFQYIEALRTSGKFSQVNLNSMRLADPTSASSRLLFTIQLTR